MSTVMRQSVRVGEKFVVAFVVGPNCGDRYNEFKRNPIVLLSVRSQVRILPGSPLNQVLRPPTLMGARAAECTPDNLYAHSCAAVRSEFVVEPIGVCLRRKAVPRREVEDSGRRIRPVLVVREHGDGGMARLNIEDSIYTDCRFMELVIALRDRERAMGCLVLAWMVAQRFYLSPVGMIPLSYWKAQKLNDALIDCGLAEIRGDFVRMAGSDEQFAWLKQKAVAGKRGGLASRSNRKIIEKFGKRPLSGEERPSSLSSLLSSSKNTTTTAPVGDLREEVGKAYGIWTETLASFSVPGTPMAPVQETSLARAIRQLGFENACLALEGQRYERPNDKFDPRRHLSVDRCLHRDRNGKSRWEEFKNMALAARARTDADDQGRRDAEATA